MSWREHWRRIGPNDRAEYELGFGPNMSWREPLRGDLPPAAPLPVLKLPWRHIGPDDRAEYELAFGPGWRAHNLAVWDAREQVVSTIHNTVAFM